MARSAIYARALALVGIVSFAVSNCVAQVVGQVATGTPTFNSFGGGPFDTVNLGNLNVHFAIPVLHKAGRGMPFTYDLSYDSSIWTTVTSNGITTWQPVNNWGWRGQTEAATGYIPAPSQFSLSCLYFDGLHHIREYYTKYIYNGYSDKFGVHHAVPGLIVYEPAPDCGPQTQDITETASDGSGWTVTISAGASGGLATSRSGQADSVPVASTSGSASAQDSNGNHITVNGSGQFFDTLSSTTPVLTVAGSGTPASPITFTYTAPSGNASYAMNFTQYTVATGFGVSGIREYGPTSNPLVSSIGLPDGSSYAFTYEKTPGSCTPLSGTYSANCITGRIASVTLPTLGTISYTYSGGGNGIESDGSTAGLARTLNPGGGWQYSRVLVTGSPGPGSTWTTTVSDPNSNQTIINFAEDSAATYNFYETQRQVYSGSASSGTLLAKSTRCYNGAYASCSTATVGSPITQTDAYSQLPNGSARLSEVVYNSFGLVTDDKEYDYGVIMGTAPGNTKLIRETRTVYASLGNGIVNKPSSVTVYDWTSGSATMLASTSYSYDQGTVTATSGTPQHISITGSRGNLTTMTTSTSSTASLSKTFTYYDTGNPNVATDVNGAQTTYVYSSAANPYNGSLTASCGNSFATTISEPLSLSRSLQWNCIGGISQQVTDENQQIVKSDYIDPNFWRPAHVYDQKSNETVISYIGQTAVETALQNFNGGNSVSDSRTTVDGFGRPILSQRLQAPGATNYDTVETDYNNIGLSSRTTMPFSAAAGITNSTAPSTNTTYDALGRVATVTDANNGTVTYTYSKNDVLQQVSGGQIFQKQFEYDGLGRLTSVCEISGTLPGVGSCGQTTTQTGYWTKYTYDALGHLLTVTQNAQASTGQQNRSFTYDWMGRMLTESNPESGNTTYIYDTSSSFCNRNGGYTSLGSLMEVVDNAGSHICWVRDAMGRQGTTYNPDSSGQWHNCRNITYGEQVGQSRIPGWSATNSNSFGRVAVASIDYNCNGGILPDEWFSYDKTGRITDVWEATPNSGGYYHSATSYWTNGALSTLSLLNSSGTPLIPAQTYGVDSEGRPNLVSAASGQNPVTSVSYSTGTPTAPLGALTGVTFGSADSDAFTYDPNTGRMASYTFLVNNKADVGTLTWNTNGTLQKLVINDQIPSTVDSQSCTYAYDDVQRVSSVTCGTFWVQNFTYDAFGNITKNVPNGDGGLAFLPSYWTSPANNQFESLPGVTPHYDSVGNLLTDNLNNYTWDGYGNMATVSTGSTTVTATYDALGRMVENNAGGTYTQFVYGPTGKLAKCNGQTLVKAFVALPGGAKAIYNTSGLAYYRHSDWLGSSRLTSTASRTLYSSSAYAPFGEQYATSGTADPSFTGQDPDTVSNLYDFPARRQSPSQGRWISPDPAGRGAVTLTKPQTWNRYAYVSNNPLSLVDPMGMDEENSCGDDDDDCGDDSSGGGGGGGGGDDNSGNGNDPNCDADACVTATPLGNPPCSVLVAGSGDTSSSPGFSNQGGITLFPYPTVAGGLSGAATGNIGISDSQLAGALNSEAAMGSNIVLTGFSAGASDIASTWNSLPASTQNQVIAINLVSPGIPWGVPNFTNANGPVPTYTFQSLNSSGVSGLEENLVNAGNWAPYALGIGPPPVYPGGVTQIDGPGHDFGDENGQMGILPTTSDCPSVISSVTTGDPEANRQEEVAIQTRPDIFAPTDESYARGQ